MVNDQRTTGDWSRRSGWRDGRCGATATAAAATTATTLAVTATPAGEVDPTVDRVSRVMVTEQGVEITENGFQGERVLSGQIGWWFRQWD